VRARNPELIDGAEEALRRAGYSMILGIPADLALVGFDNVAYTDYFGVPLTTIEQHRHEIGATAATLLLDRLAGRRLQPGRVVIATRLIVRRSSAPVLDRQ
jgi:DNA-binding LacI/PurR family transcriptional regulator